MADVLIDFALELRNLARGLRERAKTAPQPEQRLLLRAASSYESAAREIGYGDAALGEHDAARSQRQLPEMPF